MSNIRTSNNQSVNSDRVRYAGFWMRLWAYIVDLLVASSISSILLFSFPNLDIISPIGWTYTAIITGIILYGYFVVMTKHFGQTIGKMIMGLRVVRKDRSPLTWKDVLFREVIGRFFYRVFGVTNLLYLVVPFHKEKQGIHDLLGETVVIHEEESNVMGELSY